jgi:hypothetical protein
MKAKRVLAAMLLATSPACMGTYRVDPSQYVQQHNPAQILVMDNSGAVHLIDGPAVKGDTIVGIESGTPDTLALPASQIEDALVKRQSKGRTFALAAGLAAGAGLAITAVVLQGAGKPCKTGNNKPDQAGNVIGGNSQCDTTLPDGTMP